MSNIPANAPLYEPPHKTNWKVFKITEIDWYCARSLDEAIAAFKNDVGEEFAEETIDCPSELSQAEMDSRLFYDEEKDTKRTFAEELKRAVNAGIQSAYMFASTEF